jgi:hypothetical protein
MVALMLDRLGVDDDDAREVIRGLIGQLEDMLDTPDGVDVALWDRDMSQ